MKAMDLCTMLKTRSVIHPSRIDRMVITGEDAQMNVSGYPWWEDTPEVEGQLTIRFEGISQMCLTSDWLGDPGFEEALETFEANRLSDTEFDPSDQARIFCSDPLPDPMAIVVCAEQVLRDCDCPFDVWDYLNGPDYARFVTNVGSGIYQLADGFPRLTNALSMQLARRGIRFIVMETRRDRGLVSHDNMLVRLGDGYLICTQARAVW